MSASRSLRLRTYRPHMIDRSGFGRSFRLGLDVGQDALVDAMHEEVGPPTPVAVRPEVLIVPGGAIEPGRTVRSGREHELTAAGAKETFQIRGSKGAIG